MRINLSCSQLGGLDEDIECTSFDTWKSFQSKLISRFGPNAWLEVVAGNLGGVVSSATSGTDYIVVRDQPGWEKLLQHASRMFRSSSVAGDSLIQLSAQVHTATPAQRAVMDSIETEEEVISSLVLSVRDGVNISNLSLPSSSFDWPAVRRVLEEKCGRAVSLRVECPLKVYRRAEADTTVNSEQMLANLGTVPGKLLIPREDSEPVWVIDQPSWNVVMAHIRQTTMAELSINAKVILSCMVVDPLQAAIRSGVLPHALPSTMSLARPNLHDRSGNTQGVKKAIAGRSSLHNAAMEGNTKEIVRLTREGGHGAVPALAQDDFGRTALHYAATKMAVKELVASVGEQYSKMLLNHRDRSGSLALHLARSEDVAEALINLGCDVTAKDFDGRNPLHAACLRGDSLLLRRLLGAWPGGSSVDQQDNFGRTCMHYAAQSNSTACIESILDHGGNVFVTDRFGATPLHMAARTGSDKAMELLARQGGMEMHDMAGFRPVDLCDGSSRRVLASVPIH